MIPPTSIDGTDITGATIDGTDVTEITVDGQTVFSAGPANLPVAYSNLVAWYPFDSATYGGSNADDVTAIIGGSGDDTAYDGSVDGATYQSSGGVTDINAGANSGAFDFDGSNDYIENVYSVSSNIGGGSVTVMAWVNVDSYTGTFENSNFIYADLNNDNDGQIFLTLDAPDDAVGMARWDGGNPRRNTVDGTFSLNTWHHVAGKYDGSSITPYIDGQPSLGDTSSGSGGWENHGPYIGAGYRLDPSFYIDGTIEDVRIYDTDLSDQQIQDIYDNTPHP